MAYIFGTGYEWPLKEAEMRMFPRDEAEEVPVMPVVPDPSIDPVLVQAIDTVARRLVALRAEGENVEGWDVFHGYVLNADWRRIEARAEQLVKELDRGEGPFQAAYNLLKARAEHEAT